MVLVSQSREEHYNTDRTSGSRFPFSLAVRRDACCGATEVEHCKASQMLELKELNQHWKGWSKKNLEDTKDM